MGTSRMTNREWRLYFLTSKTEIQGRREAFCEIANGILQFCLRRLTVYSSILTRLLARSRSARPIVLDYAVKLVLSSQSTFRVVTHWPRVSRVGQIAGA